MEDDSNLNEQDGDNVEDIQHEQPLTGIIMFNVRDLDLNGLTNFCSNYGRVTSVRKHATKPDIGFIEYATESDATMAIQRINSKIGFGYRAQFQHPKPHTFNIQADPTAVQQVDEDWEKQSVKRRTNYSCMLPLVINFPERELLCTKTNYLSTVAGPLLRKVDPELFFFIQKVLPVPGNDKQPESHNTTEQEKRLDADSKDSTGGQYHAGKNEYQHAGLSDEQLARFGPVQYCVVCGGYGFLYCAKCDTNYCSALHQKQHLAKHDRVCPGKGAGDGRELHPVTPADGGNPVTGSVLARDPLPNKVHVYITAVLTHDSVFVRSADPAAESEYLQTLADCEMASLDAKPVQDAEPVTGEIYLAPGAPQGTHGRVLLIEPGPEESKCVFIDHGTLCFVSNGALLHIDDPALKYRKVIVYKVRLADITDEVGDREKAVIHLNKLKEQRLEMKYRMEAGNMVEVQLRTGQGANVNEKINRLIIIPPVLPEKDCETYIMYEDIIHQTYPPLGDNKSIMILSRTTVQFDGRVNWIAMDDLPYLQTLHEKVQQYGKKVSDFERYFTPRLGELCLIRCLNRWYRAVCYETAGDCRPAVFLCDYGCILLVDLLDIRKIPPQLATQVRTHDGVVKHLLEAKAAGLKIDSDLLDVFLPENDPVMADISQETKHESLIESDEPELYTILNIHMFSDFAKSLEGRLINK